MGYRPAAEELVRLRDHGVSAGFVRELRGLGYDRLSAEELIRLRDRGVSPSFVRRMNMNSNGQRMPVEQLIKLHDAGA